MVAHTECHYVVGTFSSETYIYDSYFLTYLHIPTNRFTDVGVQLGLQQVNRVSSQPFKARSRVSRVSAQPGQPGRRAAI